MARIRTIKPTFWEDEQIASLPIPCRLFFIGCWNFADDLGTLKASPQLLKCHIYPYDGFTAEEVGSWVNMLIDKGLLIPVEYEGQKYLVIKNWKKHQKIDKISYLQFLIPAEAQKRLLGASLGKFDESSTTPHRALDEPSPQYKDKDKYKDKEGEGEGGKDGRCIVSPAENKDPMIPSFSERFKETWNKLIMEPKWKKKSSSELATALKNLSDYEEEFAIKLMDDAIAHHWQEVVFPETAEKYEKWKRSRTRSGTSKDIRKESAVVNL